MTHESTPPDPNLPDQIQQPDPRDMPTGDEVREPRVQRRQQAPAVFITDDVDLVGNRVDFAQTYRFHDTIPGATTNLVGRQAELDNTLRIPTSREGHPISPRTPPANSSDTSRERFAYEPRRVEGAMLATRAAIGGLARRIRGTEPSRPHQEAPTHTQPPFINHERYAKKFNVDSLLELDAQISTRAEQLIADWKNDHTDEMLTPAEEARIRQTAHREKLTDYAGPGAAPELVRQIESQRAIAKARVDYAAAQQAQAAAGGSRSTGRPKGQKYDKDPVVDAAISDAIRQSVRDWRAQNGYPDDEQQPRELFEETKAAAKAKVLGKKTRRTT